MHMVYPFLPRIRDHRWVGERVYGPEVVNDYRETVY